MSVLIWTLLVLALLALLAAGAWTIPHLRPPDVKLTSLRPEQLLTPEQRLRVGLRVLNPNPLPLPVLSMTFRLWLEGRFIASGQGELHRRVPARGTADMEAVVNAGSRNLARGLPRLALKPQPWAYRLEGTVTILPRVSLPYVHEGRIDLAGVLRLAASLR